MKFDSGYNHGKTWLRGSIVCLAFLLLAIAIGWGFSSPALAEESVPPDKIILTWTTDPATSQTITWLMSGNSPAGIQYSEADKFNGDFESALQIEVGGGEFDSTHFRYTANITGLLPDTTYVYRVGREGAWSQPLSFTTAADTETFSFLYMGDVQSGYAEWGKVLTSVYQEYPVRFSLLGGDLTDNENEWGQFLDAATRAFSRIPVMPTMGNHDGYMYLEFFALPDNGPGGFEQTVYSFDYGNAHFVILDSSNNTDEGIKQWLQQDLQNTDETWKFVVFHHPAYPVASDYKGIDQSIRENWIPILEQYNVDMVFVGHQHMYMRTYPIYQGEVQTDPESYGIVYVMGNAGSKTYAGGGDFPYIAKEQTGSNYQVIDIDGNVLTLTSKKTNGDLIEAYTIDKVSVSPEKPQYKVIPKEDAVYTIGTTTNGLNTMTVNPNQTGFKYFTVSIEPVKAHEGTETAVFIHLRNNLQLQLNASEADFDIVRTAKAGFNVEPNDEVRVYIVDQLSNDTASNPVVLQ